MEEVADLGAVLGIWAHPDDETYLAGGVMAAAVDRGQPVACVTATAGEQGTDDPKAWPPRRLARLRESELARALQILGVDHHRWLGYADGSLEHIPVEEAIGQLVSVLERFRPDTVLTFGPDGMTGHPDHIAVGRWARGAAGRVSNPPRVLAAAKDIDWKRRFADLHERFDVFRPGYPHAVAAADLTNCFDLPDDVLDRKAEALRAQESQTAPIIHALGWQQWREWIRAEAFVALEGPS